jgi:CRISPR system Cascade subunit CasD
MTEFLLFTLCAPLASWGEIAVGEARGSWDRPSRSAVLGLLAAGLGLTRDRQDAHDTLDRSLGIAVRADASGESISDYHTTQTVGASLVARGALATRRELMSVPQENRETILSRRTYRANAIATIALWQRAEGHEPLSALRGCLERPAFVPYAGRKANALGLPMAPSVETRDTLAEAFAARESSPAARFLDPLRPAGGWGREVAHDPCEQFASGLAGPIRRELRRDTHPDRSRWQFAERVVEIGYLPENRNSGGGA